MLLFSSILSCLSGCLKDTGPQNADLLAVQGSISPLIAVFIFIYFYFSFIFISWKLITL